MKYYISEHTAKAIKDGMPMCDVYMPRNPQGKRTVAVNIVRADGESPTGNVAAIKESVDFINSLWEDHKAMQDTINTDHPNFYDNYNSEEYECYRNHELAMMNLERIKLQLYRLYDYLDERD